MFNLQGSEVIVILLLALVVLGPEKLPDAIRKFTQTYGELRKMGNGFQSELKSALDEPMREMRETADLVQRAADPARLAEEAEDEARLRAEADAAAANGSVDMAVDAAAHEVMDPVAAANQAAPAEPTPSNGAARLNGQPANGESVKKVNQIALSMARGPIDPKPEPLTAPTAGAVPVLAPPLMGTAIADAPPLPVQQPAALSSAALPPPESSAAVAEDAEAGAS